MTKVIAILNVIAWAGFWAFGYIALTSEVGNSAQMVTAAVLAAMGGAVGMWAYLQLVRHNENTGYAKRPSRADKSHLEMNANGESA
ncbi:hypothetical protein RXV86_09365 [Alisedimentitalea sp. MJ-SS2]|uniref:hypothetical protein n=1 Tax=Aliisedimentitalea sp. MJ-SS2 TaxID=3049795 RepID=UPI00290C69BF|nr:hypothetical protein [Alisedimentitalea sp. MJ-SS2]MDU8927591.1 hypothetical protein [Alisedimentitalea sp. MJ-SS2]